MNDDEKPTLQAVIRSMTGFDELAITKAFRCAFGDLGGSFPGRALVFLLLRHQGKDDKTAYNECMEMTVDVMEGHFQPVDEESEGNEDGPILTSS